MACGEWDLFLPTIHLPFTSLRLIQMQEKDQEWNDEGKSIWVLGHWLVVLCPFYNYLRPSLFIYYLYFSFLYVFMSSVNELLAKCLYLNYVRIKIHEHSNEKVEQHRILVKIC